MMVCDGQTKTTANGRSCCVPMTLRVVDETFTVDEETVVRPTDFEMVVDNSPMDDTAAASAQLGNLVDGWSQRVSTIPSQSSPRRVRQALTSACNHPWANSIAATSIAFVI